MADSWQRKRALAEAKKAHRAAGQKVSRLEHAERPVRIRQNGLDPRESASVINQMTTRQLKQYTSRLQQFNSRQNSYVAGVNGMPIPAAVWRAYTRQQSAVNRKVQSFEAPILGLKLPGGDDTQTIGQRLAGITAKNLSKAGQPNRIYAEYDKQSTQFEDASAVQEMTEALKKKTTAEYKALARERVMNSVRTVLSLNPGLEEFIEKVEALDDDTFIVVAEYSPFMRIAENYVYPESDEYKRRDAAYHAKTGERFIDQGKRDLQQVLDWAASEVAEARKPKRDELGRFAPKNAKQTRRRAQRGK